uniref:ubiquitinyl hydrolase 1 n=1 Tax=Neogobius melanostomus TaxID=47308 RepID=A0A8C6TLS9_9GOBI
MTLLFYIKAKIQSMKNAVPKNDKKRRKQLTEEIAKLESDLNQKHEEELKQPNDVEALTMHSEPQQESKQPRATKAQKRRDKKAVQERERECRIAEAEVENLLGARHQEGLTLAQKLSQQQLQIKEISSDGHCMYRAIEDQLAQRSLVHELRCRTAEHMRSHAEDFLPFLTNPNTGDFDVEHTAAWGGQLELRALTHVLHSLLNIHTHRYIYILFYMRHAYGLGEHYNSVERLKEPLTSEEKKP